MVLAKASAQYKFLQVLSRTYVYMLASLKASECIVNPQLFQDCTDYNTNSYLYDVPYLPVASELVAANDPYEFDYSDYSTVYWYGFNASNFQTSKFITASTAALYAACAANSTCTASYSQTANADAVISALATTNVNTVSRLLTANPKMNYYPYRNFGYFATAHSSLTGGTYEIYGLHTGVIQAMSAGTVNATTYLAEYNLGNMLIGGFQVYEAMIHVGAVGSWSPNDNAQSNINLTAPQYFTHVSQDGTGLDTRSAHASLTLEDELTLYHTKWEIWEAQSRGVHISNETRLIEEIQRSAQEAQPYYRPPSRTRPSSRARDFSTRVAQAQCSPPPDNQRGIAWLGNVTRLCTSGPALNGIKAISGPLATSLAAKAAGLLTSAQYSAVRHTYAGILSGQIISLCSNGVLGFPCYPGTDAWHIASGVTSIVSVLNQVADYSNPTGAVIGFSNLFCGVAGIAQAFYVHDLGCCSKDCTSPSCQSSIYGCTQGSGLC